MNPHFPEPTVDEWRQIDFSAILETADDPTTESFHSVLLPAVKQAESEEDQSRVRPLALAFLLTSMIFEERDGKVALHPLIVSKDGHSSANIDSFTDKQLNVLEEVVTEIDDPELRARIADVLWSRRPRDQFAVLATSAYLESVKRLEGEPFYFDRRLKRAAQIATSMKRDRSHFDAITTYAEDLLKRLISDDTGGLMGDVVEMLLAHKAGDVAHMMTILIQAAERLKTERQFTQAGQYFELAQRCAKQSNDLAGFSRAVEGEAESHVGFGQAFDNGDPMGALIASSHYGTAIQTYRKAGKGAGFGQRIEELQKRVLECQALGEGAMSRIGARTEIPKEMTELVEKTRGMTWLDAMGHLIAYSRIPVEGKLIEDAKKKIGCFPLQHLFQKVIMKDGGKTAAIATPADPGKELSERTLNEEAHSAASMYRQILGLTFIDPVRQDIVEEHGARPEHMQAFVVNNAFVPENRQHRYLKGLMYGLQGDYDTSAHILIPQIENSLRLLLTKQGVITSGFDQDGVQKDFDLNRMLPMPEVGNVLGENLRFELRGLLVGFPGSNIRNDLLHGLVADGGMEDPNLTYLWCLVLRILSKYAGGSGGEEHQQCSKN